MHMSLVLPVTELMNQACRFNRERSMAPQAYSVLTLRDPAVLTTAHKLFLTSLGTPQDKNLPTTWVKTLPDS